MTNIKETIVNECLNVLNREDVKKELKNIMRPLIDMLIKFFSFISRSKTSL